MMRPIKTFTMIELLVVIGILVVLISLLNPSLKSMMENAHKLGCSENLRKIGAAYHLYAEDEDGAVADCLFIGSTSHRGMWVNTTRNNYRAAVSKGPFHGGEAGYLQPYLNLNENLLTCPGSEYQQGLEAFGTSRFINGLATYTSFTPYNFMVRKNHEDYVINPNTDESRGWDTESIRPVYFDPVVSMRAWRQVGGRWDQEGSVIHNNNGTMPILMSDGHVFDYNRDAYPLNSISETGFSDRFLMIDQIFEQL